MMNQLGQVGLPRHLTLDDVEGGAGPRIRLARLRRRRLQIALCVVGVLLAVLFALTFVLRPAWLGLDGGASDTQEAAVSAGGMASTPGIDLPPPDLLKPLTPQQAQQENAKRPIDSRADDPASSFRLSGDAISKLRAIDCLTQAIYYEAASEGVDGGRAVAQVVLNRVRHPAYPNSVCGVVYQGSERVTGCQFSFTCDGSLARTPIGYIWQRSKLIATEALASRVFASVGHATHYHADYVVPYWADSLDKVAVIGRHIFYRLRGRAGARGAFVQPYRGAEPQPPALPSHVVALELEPTAEVEPLVPEAELPRVEEDKIVAVPASETAAPAKSGQLEADLARGQLLLGEPPAATSGKAKRSPQDSGDCADGPVQRLKPLGAKDLKAGSAQRAC
jgi:spore germination cell wall hydrolase CwlJ-like protein